MANNTILKKRLNIINIPIYLLLILLSLVVLFPIYIMIVDATHTSDEIAQLTLVLPGLDFFDNYHHLASVITSFFPDYFKALMNSFIISTSATLLSTFFGSLAAFAFAKYDFKGKKILFTIVILSMIFPQQISIIGFSAICDALNMMKTFLPLIIPAIANSCFVFFIKYYIESSIPDSVMDSARLDGCSEFEIFTHIILPMIVPAITTMALITFFSNWNSFLVPIVILDYDNSTIPIFATFCKGLFGNDYGAIYFGIAISTAPILIMYPFFAKRIMRGITIRDIKD